MYIYRALREKSTKTNFQSISIQNLREFTKEVTKNIANYDDYGPTWVIYKYNYDPEIDLDFVKKTYSRYITPNIQYTLEDLNTLKLALIQLKIIAENIAKENKTFIGLKYNKNFEKYFEENDNIKLYCIKQEDSKLVLQIEKQFLNLLNNKENNRLYKDGIDDGFSFGQKLSRKLATKLISYLLQNNCNSQQAFNWFELNFENLIKQCSVIQI